MSRTSDTATATEPKQHRSRATRQRLLEAAVTCLATKGWEASTVAVIAAEAGISRGAVQHHFRTREDLVLASLRFIFDERKVAVEATQMPRGTGRERVHAVVTLMVDVYGGDLFRAALQVWTVAAADAQLRDAVLPMERTFAREVHEMAVRLLDVDDSDPHSRALIQATLDLARGLALANLLTDDTRRRRHVVATWADQLSEALGISD
ncbi:MAG: TetR/AcrR family transcriptional regulator [Dermatophilaceae bacterium]